METGKPIEDKNMEIDQIVENKDKHNGDKDSSSETSSYQSSNDAKDKDILKNKMMIDGKEMVLESASSEDEDVNGDEGPMDLDDEEGMPATSYQKTAHELDPEEIEKAGPEIKQVKLDDLDEINEFGQVVQFIPEGNGILLVMPSNPEQLLDLDNIVCTNEHTDNDALSKVVVGFISDIVGPVHMPLYCVAIYKHFATLTAEHYPDTKDYMQGK